MSPTRRQIIAKAAAISALAMANEHSAGAQVGSPTVAMPPNVPPITKAEAQAAVDRYIAALTAVNPTAIANQFTVDGVFQDTQFAGAKEFTGMDDIVRYWNGLVEGYDKMAFNVISCQAILDPADPLHAIAVIVWHLTAHHGGKKNSIAGTPSGAEIRIFGSEWLTLAKDRDGHILVERDSSVYNGKRFEEEDSSQ